MTRLLFALALAGALCATPAFAQTVIVDNSDGAPEFITTGNDWTSWGMLGNGYDGGDGDYLYLSHTLGGSDRRGMAIWTPNLPVAGRYEVATWFRRTSNRTSDADFVVRNGTGGESRRTLNQRGDGASGWVTLGRHWCDAGLGGCRVTLDGTDDDQSDEANAVRFRLLRADDTPGGDGSDDPPEDPPAPAPCSTYPGLGDHQQQGFATVVDARDFEDRGRATGAPDRRGAHSPNLDAGEFFRASGWTVCDPAGDETITSVRLATRARTQYQSGRYDIDVRLHAGGSAARIWKSTDYRWHTVDVTGDRASWTWADVAAMSAELRLERHPNGRRDSDVWVDAFRVRVRYTTTAPPGVGARDVGDEDDEPSECGDAPCGDASDAWAEADNADDLEDDEAPGDPAEDDAPASDEPGHDPGADGSDDPEPSPDDGSTEAGTFDSGDGDGFAGGSSGCGQSLDDGAALALLLLVPPLGLRRRERL